MPDAKRTVLIVEDNGDLRRLFCLALKLEGFTVAEAGDGYGALLMLERHRVDLVVLDLRLPGVDGLVVQQEIESRAAHERIPVIIVTSSIQDLSHVNVARILRKPVLPAALVETVREVLE